MATSRLTDYVLSRSLDGGFERCMVFCEVRHHVIPSFATSSELFLCNKSKSAVNRLGDSYHRIPSDQAIPLLYNKRTLAPFQLTVQRYDVAEGVFILIDLCRFF